MTRAAKADGRAIPRPHLIAVLRWNPHFWANATADRFFLMSQREKTVLAAGGRPALGRAAGREELTQEV